MNLSTDPWIWLQATLIICVFSFLWRDNYVYGIAQALYVGFAAAHGAVLAWTNIRSMVWTPLTVDGRLIVIVPAILGLLLFTRFFRGMAWMSRIALAVPIGVGTGIALRAIPAAQIWGQIAASARDVSSLNGLISLVGVVCTLAFFLFTPVRFKPLPHLSRIGLAFMCVTFGVTFATAILSYISIFFGPANTIFRAWLGMW